MAFLTLGSAHPISSNLFSPKNVSPSFSLELEVKNLDEVNVTHKNVLLRLDLNLPMSNGEVIDSTRIIRSLSTINELLQKQAKIIILSHFGRPKGKINLAYTLKPIAEHLQQFVECPVVFAPDCVGDEVKRIITDAPQASIIVLENLRFHEGEEKNDAAFAKELSSLGQIYINDAFSCTHRAHASVAAICEQLPSYAGRALEQELTALQSVLKTPKKPVMAIVGGSKISTKIELLQNLLPRVDYLVIGGGMANTFLAAQAVEVGQSLCEDDYIPTAQEILMDAETHDCEIVLPIDVVVTATIAPNVESKTVSIDKIAPTQKVVDIGPKSLSRINHFMDQCQTLVWNGPVGVFEIEPFDLGSVGLAHHIAALTKAKKLISVAGGGDTLAALAKADVEKDLSYTSTAGGAFLEWLEGKKLPGVVALQRGK
ncbi:phosphoglycerate kinase [Candidatus Paracaedibacter symbiosus]|uniref:phosphoglycerate kinase n=1 Tax=Candidatus Paracaedibacter symbiosus TaxID=244582 RepID=UPI0009FFD351|nr:phosphoglycerate kinase [Candidatus Paracaedibacter symbiosus]